MKRASFSLKPAALPVMLFLALAAAGCGDRSAVADAAPPTPVVVSDVITLNDISIRVIEDSSHSFKAELFPDIARHPEWSALMPGGAAEGVVRTYLVRTGDRLALIDAGWGAEIPGHHGRTAEILAENGIRPDMITDILLTHMDGDHIAGLLRGGRTFYPNAVLHVARKEHDSWVTRGMDRPIMALERARRTSAAYGKRLRLFDYGEAVLPGIVGVEASGHTNGHTVYDIASGDAKLTVVGDLLHAGAVQLRHTNACTRYDAHPDRAARAREDTLARLHKEGRIIAGMHFKDIGFVRPAPEGGWMVRP